MSITDNNFHQAFQPPQFPIIPDWDGSEAFEEHHQIQKFVRKASEPCLNIDRSNVAHYQMCPENDTQNSEPPL